MWICSDINCQQPNDDDVFCCEACGEVRANRLHLKNQRTAKDWSTAGTFQIDRSVYKELFNEEYKYLPKEYGNHPYTLCKRPDGKWCLIVNSNSMIAVALGDVICEAGTEYEISVRGSVISLVNPHNHAVKLAPVQVEIVFG